MLTPSPLDALYGHYAKTFELWQKEGINVPPCFIVVCNNTSTSKLVYDYISGFHRQHEDGSSTLENGRLGLFRNFDDHGNQIARPRTLLIDSEQLESGDALDDNFRNMASDEIDRFRREIIERTGDRHQAEKLSDEDLLREVMQTVGKVGRLGEPIRCVVSVSMLTDLPLIRVLDGPPLIDLAAELVDDGSGVVLLGLGGETVALIEDKFFLLLRGTPLSRLRDRRDEFGLSAVLDDLVCRLTIPVQFPMARRIAVRGIEDRMLEE